MSVYRPQLKTYLEFTKLPLRTSHVDGNGLMTIDQFAAEIGLTTRTIRSYHARDLLPPPVRVGRTPYYGASHLARMRQVLRLQSRGLPLEAIRALLEPDLVLAQFLPPGHAITASLRAEPELFSALVDSGVLVQRPDGGLVMRSARAILAAQAVCRPDVPAGRALSVLADAVAAMQPYAKAALTSVHAAVQGHPPTRTHTPDYLRELAVEVFRLCLMQLDE